MKIIKEKYISNLGHREDHYYKQGNKHEEYLFGINPKVIKKKIVKKILKSLKK